MHSTRRFREYILAVVAVLSAALVGTFMLAKSVTDGRRDEAIRVLKKPETVTRYERLVAQAEPKPIRGKQSEPVEAQGLEAKPAELEQWGSRDKLARWDALLKRWERFTADKREDGWPAVSSALEYMQSQEKGPKHQKTPEELTPEERALVEACLAREQDLIDEIRDVAELGGPVNALDFSDGVSLELPHLMPIREMSGFLVWDAVVKAQAGDVQGAVKSLDGGMALGAALQEEPLLLSQLVRQAIIYRVEWTLCEGFEAGQLAPAELGRILSDLEKAKRRKAFADAFRGEACIYLHEFDSLRNGKRKSYFMEGMGERNNLRSRLLFRVYTGPLGTSWLNTDETVLIGALERIAAAAERPYYQVQSELAALDKELADTSYTLIYTKTMFMGLRRGLQSEAQFETSIDLTRLGLFIEEYRALHGAYPPTLEAIAAHLGGTVPVDPFSGQGYHYSADSESFLLYGVGSNLRDDGGTPNWHEGDIVWRGEQ